MGFGCDLIRLMVLVGPFLGSGVFFLLGCMPRFCGHDWYKMDAKHTYKHRRHLRPVMEKRHLQVFTGSSMGLHRGSPEKHVGNTWPKK